MSVAPLSVAELDTLHAVCTVDAWRAIVAFVSVRTSGRQFVEGAFSQDGAWFHTATCDRAVLPRWRAQAAALGGVTVEKRHWDAARAFGKAEGVELSIQRAARTYSVDVLSVGDPFNTLAVEYSLSRRVVDRSYGFLPVPSDETCRRFLRGTDWL